MGDFISRQAAIDAVVGITMFKTKHELMQRVNASVQDEQGWLGAVAECLDEIEDLPSAQPVRHGYWIEVYDDETACKCSCCGHEYNLYEEDINGYPYCANCGAKMDGERKEHESL